MILDVVVGVLFFWTSLTESVDTARKLFKSAFGIYSARSLYQSWAAGYFSNFVIHDLDTVLKLNNGESEMGQARKEILKDTTLIESLQRSRKGLRIVHVTVLTYNGIMILFYAMPLVSNAGFSVYKYYMPIQILLGMLWSLVVLKAWKHNSVGTGKSGKAFVSSKTTSTDERVAPALLEPSVSI
mmetsp:Transcript_1607/g.1895  ORF Transcript_1607/g.1895 Transcript_1607/m.1895 type:complete len:184 (+) Transcript_1607:1-552(+)